MATINGTSGNDTLNGTVADDTINGLAGDDNITGGDGADTLDGGDGNDSIDGGLGNDTLIGGNGDDYLTDSYGLNSFDGGAGYDYIQSYSPVDGQIIHGGDGNDEIRVFYSGNDIIDGGDGDDTITVDQYNPAHANQTVTGGAGNDNITVYANSSTVSGGTGTDTIYVNGNTNTVTEDGTGNIYVQGSNNTVTASAGNDRITVSGNTNTVLAGDGNDTIAVNGNANTVTGGAGRDTFQITSDGYATNTVITDFTAGAGGDSIDVGAILTNAIGYPGGNPFGSGYLSLVQSGVDTLLMWDRDGIASAYAPMVLATLQNVTASAITSDNVGGYNPSGGATPGSTITGTSGNDTLTGTVGNDTIYGLAGGDNITGGDGNDTLDGGDDNDSLDGGLGNDTLIGGNGDDYLTDSYGVNSFDGGAGYDYIQSYSPVDGQIIHGGDGNDQIRVFYSGNDIIDGGDGDDSITVDQYNPAHANQTVTGGAGNDNITVYANSSTISGGTGTDTIYVNGNTNTVTEDGTGNIYVQGSNNTVTASAGNDRITVSGNTNTVLAGDGNDTIAVNGNANTVTGGAGRDTFQITSDGYATNTVITDFTAGAGGDSIDVGAILTNAIGYPGGNPFGSGYLSLVQSGVDTLLMWDRDGIASAYAPMVLATLQNVTASAITSDNVGGYNPSGGATPGSTITGTSGNDTLNGTVGNDTIYGLAGGDNITGGDGNDTLDGGDDNDSLDGGLGNDTLIGGNGDDYLSDSYGVNSFDGGAGYDYIQSYSPVDGQIIHGGDGNDEIRVFYSGSDIIDGGDGDDSITVDQYNPAHPNQTVTGGAGNDNITVYANSSIISGGTGTDTIYVNGNTNTVTEDGTGNIYVQGSNNTITTGAGNVRITVSGTHNTVSAGGGNDTISLNGDGNTATGGAGRDTFQLGSDGYTINTVITDFTVAAGGDMLDIGNILTNAINYPGNDPFGRGYVTLVQNGADTQLLWDRDGSSGSSYTPVVLATLRGVNVNTITAANVGGYNPRGGAAPPVGDFAGITVNEDASISAIATATDVDSPSLTYALVTGPAHGGIVFTSDGHYTYTPTANYNGADSFTFKANDGALDSEAATISITVVSVNDAPSGANATISTVKDTAHVFTASDFGYADIDGNALLAVKVTALTGAGALTLNGGAVTVGQSVAASEIVAGHLLFTPAAGAVANGYATIGFQVRDDGGTANGGVDLDPTPNTLTLDVIPPPAAVADSGATGEGATTTIAVLGKDINVSDPTSAIASINGSAIAVGGHATLASGAIVTLNADGTLGYDPNHMFDYLVSAVTGTATGAVSSATDSFTYALVGGGSATVNVTVNGADGAGDQLRGDAGDNTLTGTTGSDYFDLSQGGNDTVHGGDGNDGFYFGAAFTGADRVDGEAGTNDQIGLRGDYTGGNALVLQAATIAGIETIAVLPGFNYNITTVDENVGAGQLLTIYGSSLGAGDALTFNGSAETNGVFRVFGGLGADTITTGAGNDGIYFGAGRFDVATDHVDGGAGTNDQMALDGTYTGLTIARANVVNVEMLVLLDGQAAPVDYSITLADDWTTGAEVHTVYGVTVRHGFTVDGSAETGSMLRFFGGAGNDTLIGGAAGNWFDGGAGADTMTGGAGIDTYNYVTAVNSMGVNYDRIVNFDASQDLIHLPFAVTGVDAAQTGALSTTSFETDLTSALATLGANHAVQFTATSGTLAAHIFEVIDVNGVAGYQAGQDMVIELVTPAVAITTLAPFV